MKALGTFLIYLIIASLLGFLLFSCSLVTAPIPDDWNDWHPNPPQEIGADTCEELTEYTNPAFISAYVIFDAVPDTVIWYWKTGNVFLPITIDQLSSSYYIFQNGNALSVILIGTNEVEGYKDRLMVLDGNGKKNTFSFSKQSLQLGGAATYDDLKFLYTELKSVYKLNYKNLGLDSLRYDTLISFQVDSFCKEGRERIDLRGIPVAQSRIDQCFEVGWNNVWHD
jgi:hypothetical protein